MSDFEFRDDAEIQAVFKMEVGREMNDHSQLYNKSFPNQHPIQAITGLETALSDIDTKEGSLSDLTTDSKTNLVSAINEVDSHADTNATNLANHIADKTNPHQVTKAQVGLGNVDNTSDLNKPISTATQSALNLKVNTADLGNAELDIQKNGTSVGKFTANASTDKVINLVIPTQASDINALPSSTKYGSSISLSINSSTFVVTAQLKDQNGNNLGSAQTIDLPLESVVVNGSYDNVNKKIVLTLENGNTIDIPVADLVAGLQSEITVDNKLSSDLVDDSGQVHKFATSAQLSQIATNTSNISNLDTNKADKSTTYTKTEVNTALSGKADKATTLAGYGITDGANTSLSNLNSDGQMIVDSQNGTISNCILDIPQNIKLTLENNVLTAKSDSILTDSGSTYQTITLTSDKTITISTSSNQRWVLFATSSGTLSAVVISSCVSGVTDSLAGQPRHIWFDTTNKEVLYYSADGTTGSHRTYPICIIDVDSEGNVSFAKDSNGNDMIFNGACFIGHHAVVYPNNHCLIADEFNADKTLHSISKTLTNLVVVDISNTNYNTVFLNNYSAQASFQRYDGEVNIPDDLPSNNHFFYVKSLNVVTRKNLSGVLQAKSPTCQFITTAYNGTTVTDFTIRQPVRTATVEMLDKKQDTLTFDTTPTSASTNPVTSGGVYTALSGKQADITTITGYDATKTQTLKNVSGVLTWVDDGE